MPEQPYKKWTKEQHFKHVEETYAKVLEVTKAKNADYAGSEDPYANFRSSEAFGIDPLVGLCLRMSDKLARIANFCKTGKLHVEGEGVELV